MLSTDTKIRKSPNRQIYMRNVGKGRKLPYRMFLRAASQSIHGINYQGWISTNSRGGMEFFAPELNKRSKDRNLKMMHYYAEEFNRVSTNMSILSETITVGKSFLDFWGSEISLLEKNLVEISASIDSIPSAECIKGNKIYQLLVSEKNRVTESLSSRRSEIDKYHASLKEYTLCDYLSYEMNEKCKDLLQYVNIPYIHTIGSSCISVLYNQGVRTQCCCLFENILDYLAYIYLVRKCMVELPGNYDCYILNNVGNFVELLVESERYQKIYCFFSETVSGKTMELTYKFRMSGIVHSYRDLYEKYICLYSYAERIYAFNIERVLNEG